MKPIWSAPSEVVACLMARIIRKEYRVRATARGSVVWVRGGYDRWTKRVAALAANLRGSVREPAAELARAA